MEMWRRALGIEPSLERSAPAAGFEDRDPHQRTLPSAPTRPACALYEAHVMMRKVMTVIGIVVLVAPAVLAAGAACAIVEGAAIGAVRIGMPVPAALAITGPAAAEQTSGRETIYTLRSLWSRMVAESGVVTRVATGVQECRTSRGVGPGVSQGAARAAYSGASVSTVTPLADGELLSYPFVGIAFVMRRDRVASVEVFRTDGPPSGARPLPPAPVPQGAAPQATTPPPGSAPAPSDGWAIRSTAAQVQGDVLIVTGTVENRGRAAAPYADVRAYSTTGRQVAHGDAPLTPTPVPARGVATFEVRLTIDDVVRRYTVTLRPARSLTATLAESTGEIKNMQQFAALVARRVRVAVEVTASPPAPDDFSVVVTNNSSLPIASAAVTVDLTVTCRLAQINFPIGRQISEQRSASVAVQQIAPGASSRAKLVLSTGVCLQFATWSATTRTGDVRIGE